MDTELYRLKRIEAAAKRLVDESPVGDDDQPYVSEVVQSEFKTLVEAVRS